MVFHTLSCLYAACKYVRSLINVQRSPQVGFPLCLELAPPPAYPALCQSLKSYLSEACLKQLVIDAHFNLASFAQRQGCVLVRREGRAAKHNPQSHPAGLNTFGAS